MKLRMPFKEQLSFSLHARMNNSRMRIHKRRYSKLWWASLFDLVVVNDYFVFCVTLIFFFKIGFAQTSSGFNDEMIYRKTFSGYGSSSRIDIIEKRGNNLNILRISSNLYKPPVALASCCFSRFISPVDP